MTLDDEATQLEVELAIENERKERSNRRVASLDDISKRVHHDRLYIVILGIAVLLVAALVSINAIINYFGDRKDDRQSAELAKTSAELEKTSAQLEKAIADIQAGRKEGRKATCDGFGALTNSLVSASTTPHDAAFKARVQAFEADLERRLGPLGCDLSIEVLLGSEP